MGQFVYNSCGLCLAQVEYSELEVESILSDLQTDHFLEHSFGLVVQSDCRDFSIGDWQ